MPTNEVITSDVEKRPVIDSRVLIMVENPLNPMHLPRSSTETTSPETQEYLRHIGELVARNDTEALDNV